MRKIIQLCMLFILLFTIACKGVSDESRSRTGEYIEFSCHTSCHGHKIPIYETRIIDIDYTEKYVDTLNAMFDYEWTILSVEEIYRQLDIDLFISDFLCHLAEYYRFVSSTQYLRWTIEYRDGNGDIRHFIIANTPLYQGFSWQVEHYVRELIREYYLKHFVEVYLRDTPLASQPNLVVWVLRASLNVGNEENQEWVRGTEEHRRLLTTPDGAVRLARLTLANAFELVPLYFTINVTTTEYSVSDQQYYEEQIIKRIEEMVASLNNFTDNSLNALIRVNFNRAEYERHELWLYYIQGERVFDTYTLYYERYVFESYKGVFW